MGTVVEETTSFTISTVPGGEPLGMENGAIPDENITASSSAGPAPPHLGRLNGLESWCTAKSTDCYLQVDLGSLHLLCAVATQGNPGGNRDYVKRYKLQCSSDGVDWAVYEENGNDIIEGNSDNCSVKRKDLEQEIITRYVRFCPVEWYCWPCMRVELYGAALNIGDKLAHLESEGGGFVVDKVLVTTYETQIDEKDYLVHIYTGDKWGAGTDANVMITIFGQDGDSGERKLDNNKNNFETGQKDSFTVTCPSLGQLSKIRIGHDNTGFGAAWFLDKVTVEDPKTGDAVDFPCQRWFSTSEEDGQITRELTRADDGGKDDIVVDTGHDYLVHIYTGDKWGAGTDANVLITIFGEDSDSGERRLDNNKNNFENGQKDSFTVSCATSLGRLSKIRIGHDDTGFSAAWFLDKVTVEDPKTGDAVAFPCQRWFSTSEDDGQITRELTRANGIDNETIVDKGHDYLVHIYTGDKWGAGTDANVLITIFGEDSDSGERRLDNDKNNFENGQKDSFTVSCATSLGRLNKIRIGHDNTGFGAAWFLDKVTVEDPKTGEAVDFPCQRWFSTSEDDGQITRELTIAVSNKDDDWITVVIDEIADLQSVEGGGFDNVLVLADETHVENNGEPGQDEISLKEQEKRIIREAKERQRKEEEQQNRLEEIQIIIEQEEGKRKLSEGDMDKERTEAEARMKLVLDEERMMQRREKPDGEDETQQQERPQEIEEKHSPEYSRIEEEHRRRMEEISAILEDDEKRRNREKEEKRKAEEDARKKSEEDKRKRDNELKQKREEERLKWEAEHRKWEEERKKRDRELEAVLDEGRRKRTEDRRKRDEELKANREEERWKRDEERKKRMELEMKKLEDLKREREERLNRNRANIVIVDLDLRSTPEMDKEEDTKNRQEEKKKKEEGWKKAVEAPRQIEDDLKKFIDEERKRLEEERKKLQESEHAEAEAEKQFKSELRVRKLGEPDTTTHVTVSSIQLRPSRDVTIAEEKRRIEWRMEKIEQDRQLREEEERKRREEVERKRKEKEESLRQEEERRQKEQVEERQRRREEMRLKREEEEKQRREEAERRSQEEDARRTHSLEERRKRLEEDRKKREDEERIWRREIEERKQKEEEERQKQIESKKIKRRSIDRKKFEEEEKKRLDAIERKKNEEEDQARKEEEQRRREERERWKMKQVEKKRSGEIYRRKSEEDLRTREDRASFKDRQRKKRDSKSFETKWMFVNGEKVEAPDDEAIVLAVSDTSYTEPDVFTNERPDTKYISVKTTETKRTQERPVDTDEKDSSQTTSTIRVISTTTTTTRTRSQGSRDKLPRAESEEAPLNGDVMPYRSQPHCDHLLPTDPAVQMAEEMSFFDKYEENEGTLRPFPSWYGGLDMGSLPHLYSPANPITDSDVDELLAIESEGFSGWKRVKKSRELEIYSRKGTERGSPPITKAVMVLKDIPYRDAIDLVSDWDERAKWDKTFDGVSFLDQMADFKVLKCSQKKKNRCLVLASLDREDEEPHYAWTWKSANHPSVPGEDTKVTVMRLDTEICGAIIRPYHDATQSSKITIITQVRGSVPSPLKSTYLTGNPSKWLIWLKKHHDLQLTNIVEKAEDGTKNDEDHKNKDDSSSVSSKSDKQD